MNEKLEILIDSIWGMISEGADLITTENDGIKFSKDKNAFKKNFMDLYEKISQNYMEHSKSPLDRHKIAAIVMVAVIKSELLKQDEEERKKQEAAGKRYLGNYILATDCGLEYMLYEINHKLACSGKESLNGFCFPEATACKTSYYNIFFRNLYYANTSDDWHLNPLDIAERLFLLEHITLKEKNIDVHIFKEY